MITPEQYNKLREEELKSQGYDDNGLPENFTDKYHEDEGDE